MARILKRLPRDVNARAVAIARALIGEDDENVDPRPLDSIATTKTRAQKGGVARAQSVAPSRRKAIAKRAAAARWNRKST